MTDTADADGRAPAALDGVRALDCAGTAGQYAGKLLADLGADVVRIEPPAGSPARLRPPFADGEPSMNRSLAFWYWNTNKRSVCLDLTTADGRALFRRLAPRFDIVIHTYAPDQATALGLDHAALTAIDPRLITCAITPFGEWGPHARYQGGDMVVSAMSGLMTLAGYPDRAPVQPPGEQAAVCGGIQAAQGILLALMARDRSGRGQHVEVSQQEAMAMTQETAMQYWDMRHELRRRVGESRVLPAYGTYACTDGHIFSMITSLGVGAPLTTLVDWMAEEGMAGDLSEAGQGERLGRVNLREVAALAERPQELAELLAYFSHVDALVSAFYRSKTKRDLYLGGQSRRLLIGPINSARDLRENEQLAARGWWQEVEHPELGRTITYPGAPYHHADTPWRMRRRPPLLGEHTVDVLRGELGLSAEQCTILMGAGVI